MDFDENQGVPWTIGNSQNFANVFWPQSTFLGFCFYLSTPGAASTLLYALKLPFVMFEANHDKLSKYMSPLVQQWSAVLIHCISLVHPRPILPSLNLQLCTSSPTFVRDLRFFFYKLFCLMSVASDNFERQKSKQLFLLFGFPLPLSLACPTAP